MIINISVSKDKFLPCYQHLLDKEFFDIDFMYGGRDSGKSRHIAMMLLLECLSAKYFRCVLIRKVKDTLKDSQWQMLKDVAEEWKIDHLFSFNKSPLEINCKNGNKFICRGCDEPQKLKSIANPSHCWIEEGNELNNTDFTIILSTLRYNDGNTKVWFSFNPECEGTYTDFWLYQEWFSHSESLLSWEWTKTVEIEGETVQYKARATHSTYKNNPYCKAQRKALYEGYKNSKNNSYWYQTYTLGLWGYRRTGGQFLKCFDESIHTKDIEPGKGTFHIVVDNNVSPYVSVEIWQIDQSNKTLYQVDELPCRTPHNTASKAALEVVKWLNARGYNDTVFVYGDPSANAKSTTDDDGKSFFEKFISTIRQTYNVHNRVKKSAPRVAASGDFINEIYESNYMGWKIIIALKCRLSIEDYVMTQEAPDGTILKKRVIDKDTKQSYEKYGHLTDCKRYFITTVLEYEFQQYGRKNSKIYGYSI